MRDAETLLEPVVVCIESGDTEPLRSFADWVAPVYRRRSVPMDDLIHLCEGLKQAVPAVLAPDERPIALAALDEAIRVLRWNRRIAGDARKRNRILHAIYRGA